MKVRSSNIISEFSLYNEGTCILQSEGDKLVHGKKGPRKKGT